MTGSFITVTAADGGAFQAYLAKPAAGGGPGIVLLQEIFGVNHHIQAVCDRFAADGYVALAPAIFDRVEPGITLGYTADDIERGRSIRGKVDIADMVRDVRAAVEALKTEALPTGVVGYCLGGTLAWLACTRIDGVKAAVGYYGGGIAETAGEVPRCPVLLHFGETDQGIPPEHWARIRAAHPEVPIHTYPAGHGFSCDERGSYHEPSARLARQRTLGFFTALL